MQAEVILRSPPSPHTPWIKQSEPLQSTRSTAALPRYQRQPGPTGSLCPYQPSPAIHPQQAPESILQITGLIITSDSKTTCMTSTAQGSPVHTHPQHSLKPVAVRPVYPAGHPHLLRHPSDTNYTSPLSSYELPSSFMPSWFHSPYFN